ncbi:MAG: hypothetical protein AMDU3_IPLC00003G0013 [Thermoplasmatales archaeon I-plasma]|nr:MAG: hypothetical protein AMDU3_IPLC00003G0013 [Thermoplasmatales archaeon I-plasma]
MKGMVRGHADGPVTLELVARAVMNGMSVKGTTMTEREAHGVALHVLGFFGYSITALDNCLEREDRNVFYALEDIGILRSEMLETSLYDGTRWRTHYWIINTRKVKTMAADGRPAVDLLPEAVVYRHLPAIQWKDGTRH